MSYFVPGKPGVFATAAEALAAAEEGTPKPEAGAAPRHETEDKEG